MHGTTCAVLLLIPCLRLTSRRRRTLLGGNACGVNCAEVALQLGPSLGFGVLVVAARELAQRRAVPAPCLAFALPQLFFEVRGVCGHGGMTLPTRAVGGIALSAFSARRRVCRRAAVGQ